MKIIKKNIKLIIGFILGAVIFGSIGVYAISVASKDVSYNNTNVESAINDLYSKVGNSKNLNLTNMKQFTTHSQNGCNHTNELVVPQSGEAIILLGGYGNWHVKEIIIKYDDEIIWQGVPRNFASTANDNVRIFITSLKVEKDKKITAYVPETWCSGSSYIDLYIF